MDRNLHIVLSDVHVPYQDPSAVSVALAAIRHYQPGTVHLLGDIADCYAVSRHRRDPERRFRFQDELDQTADFLHDVWAASPGRIIYSAGNHEDRLSKYLLDRADELAGLRSLQLPKLLGLPDMNIEWRTSHDPYQIKGLWFTHGDLIRKHAGYSARAMAEKVGSNVIVGHTHRLGHSHITNWDTTFTGWENGCLCRLDPEYVQGTPNWQQGFHLVQFYGTQFAVEPILIQDGQALIRGKPFKAARSLRCTA